MSGFANQQSSHLIAGSRHIICSKSDGAKNILLFLGYNCEKKLADIFRLRSATLFKKKLWHAQIFFKIFQHNFSIEQIRQLFLFCKIQVTTKKARILRQKNGAGLDLQLYEKRSSESKYLRTAFLQNTFSECQQLKSMYCIVLRLDYRNSLSFETFQDLFGFQNF